MSGAGPIYDVAVVGAGPAGAAAAIAACRAGATVVLLDRAVFPRDKVCGDGVAAEAFDVLEALGVTGIADDCPPIERLRLIAPGGAEVARQLPRPAHTIPRKILDARLVEAAIAAGAELRHHTVRTIRQNPSGASGVSGASGRSAEEKAGASAGGWASAGGSESAGGRASTRARADEGEVVLDGLIRARVVIGADGAGSVVRRALGHAANPPGHLAIAIRGYGPAIGDEQLIRTTSQRWPAYAWSFPLGDGTANIGYGEVLRGTALSRAYLKERLAALLPGGEPAGLRAHHLPLSTHRPPPAHGPVLLAGDALSLINPFTGEGIFYAVLSGALAGAAAAAGPDGVAGRYTRALHHRLGRHLRHSGAVAQLSRQSWVVDAAVRAARRDGRVFRRMVDLGLGDGVFDLRTIGRIGAELLHFPRPPSWARADEV